MAAPHQRLLILTDGSLGVFDSKTATCLLRYRPGDVVGVLDRGHAGKTAADVLGVPSHAPIVATMEEGLALRPDALVIGIAPPGGALPAHWRAMISQALERGVSVLSGLHVFLADDPGYAALAEISGASIVDYRRPPEGQPIAHRDALKTRARRVLTVGTDCNIGKMVAAVELDKSARGRGLSSRFLATGQTGMLISGSGLTLDRIPGDFMAGFIEQMVVENGDADLVIVEGQGCILHPAFSGVTMALLHGSLPDAMILVHHAARQIMRSQTLSLPPLADWVRRYEDAVAPLHPGKVTGIAINPYGLTEAEASDALRRAEDETGLPAVDVVKDGADRLLEGVLN